MPNPKKSPKTASAAFAAESGVRVGESADKSETFTLFYGTTTCFSNFYPSTFTADGKTFNCGEQYFHYLKAVHFNDDIRANLILAAEKPGQQKALGRQVINFDKDEWSRVCFDYMKETIMEKFSQNPELLKELMKTKMSTLVEASPRDRIWGIGLGKSNDDAFDRTKWKGQNLLGKALTECKFELHEKKCDKHQFAFSM